VRWGWSRGFGKFSHNKKNSRIEGREEKSSAGRKEYRAKEDKERSGFGRWTGEKGI